MENREETEGKKMNITLQTAGIEDAGILHQMQVRSFMPLLEKYQDFEISPTCDTVEKMEARISQTATDYYMILQEKKPVGGIRIVKMEGKRYRVSPVFILPEHQGKGIAQEVFRMIERIYSDADVWELDTILQEQGNCRLYEKIGYRQTGDTKVINDRMTLVFYEKRTLTVEYIR